ncbi:MAG: HD domain-containing protein [Firmicutes bacterium]|nr:HD domain-containing protein [Bacillota bacterium]
MRINIPKKVRILLNELTKNNFKGYVVGGCVRDFILNRKPEDWDITTNATPKEILEVFKKYKTIPTGLKHGTVTVLLEKEAFEITTFRIDGEYIDNRRPEIVEFTNDIKKDLSRRDFTINAMAYNLEDGLIDPFKGLIDLKKKKIVAVREADKRFEEDALRILRGVRFKTQLDFNIEKITYKAMNNKGYLLNKISKERIQIEFNKMLLSSKPSKGIRTLIDLEIMKYIIPEINDMVGFNQKNPHHDKDVFNHTMAVLDNTESDIILRLSALLHDIAKPYTFSIDEEGIGHFYKHERVGRELAGKILKRLKYDKKTIKRVKTLIKEHMLVLPNPTLKATKRFINRVGKDNLNLHFDLQIADIKGTKPPFCFDHTLKLQRSVEKILNEKQPLSTKDLDINGNDIINLGISQGKEIGIILKELLEKVLEDPKLNTKDKLIGEAKKIIERLN